MGDDGQFVALTDSVDVDSCITLRRELDIRKYLCEDMIEELKDTLISQRTGEQTLKRVEVRKLLGSCTRLDQLWAWYLVRAVIPDCL